MGGYAFMTGSCFACGGLFTFHPHKVPSIKDDQGVRQPICKGCIEAANKERPKYGLEPFKYPQDAYSPCPEEEL